MTAREYYIESFKGGRFNRMENGAGIFDLDKDDVRNFPELKGVSQIVVKWKGKKLSVQKIRKNVEGYMQGGTFHPIRASADYEPELGGDYDKLLSGIGKRLRAKTEKKKAMPKKNTAKTPAKKRTTAKKPATKKRAVKKNSAITQAISTFANVAVGTSAALDVHSRMKKKARARKKPAARKVAKVKKNLDVGYYETQFAKYLDRIENGDFKSINAAKLAGKLAGFAANEANILIQRARLTHRLKTNPTTKDVRAGETAMLKQNGIFSRYNERRKAGKFLKRELKLEAAIKRARTKLAAAKKKAVANPAKPKIKRNSASYESFQGRPSTKTIELVTPETAPRRLYNLGILFELKVKGIVKPVNFRRTHSGRTFYICADEQNKQLWIAGGKCGDPQPELTKGYATPLGEIIHIIYETQKVHLGDDDGASGYIHKFGDEGGMRPQLAIDRHGFGIIQDGEYEITPLGIRN